jgi:hypothetical protein
MTTLTSWTDDTRPLLLLDVDGPLNPYAMHRSNVVDAGYTAHRMTPEGWIGQPLRVLLNPDHGPLLTDLAAEHDMELVWATTWEGAANTLIGPAIGLPELPVISFGDSIYNKHWKFTAVLKYAGDRDLVWIDDDFGTTRTSAIDDFMVRRGTAHTYLHQVSQRHGLTAKDVEVIARWATTTLEGQRA